MYSSNSTTLTSSFLDGCIAVGFSLVTSSEKVLARSTQRRGLLSSNLTSLTICSCRGRLHALLK
uniref:Uncharacterized protein n=1 Tax=Glossina austeni TaxID=7395 RepID=A0A1A9US01_GLOAU